MFRCSAQHVVDKIIEGLCLHAFALDSNLAVVGEARGVHCVNNIVELSCFYIHFLP